MASGFEHFNGHNQINEETSSTQTDEILKLINILKGMEKFPEEQSNVPISGVFNEFKYLKAKVDAISEELIELRSFTKDVMVTLRELTKSFIQEERTKSEKLTNLEEEVKLLRSETSNAIEKSRNYLEKHITYQLNRNEDKFAGLKRERKNVKSLHED